MKLYKYTGTISEVSFRNRTACDIKLYDMNDRDKAPTRLEVFGALGKYILDIEGTDAEERYIPNVFYFDDNLYLWRIEIPGGEVGRPAKIITQSRTTSTSWKSSASRTISRPASRNPCPARKFTAGPIGNART